MDIVPQYGAAPEYILATGSNEITLSCSEAVTLGTTAETATSFYFIVAPNTLSKGISISFIDAEGKKIEERHAQEIVIERNQLTTIEPVEVFKEVVSDVILDVQFGTDGKATDEGRFNLAIQKKVNEADEAPFLSTYTNSQFNLNNIARFGGYPHNLTHSHSFYCVDISGDDMQDAMKDGFTLETVAMFPISIADHWSRLISTETFGIMRQGSGFTTNAHPFFAYFNNPGNSWHQPWGVYWKLIQQLTPNTYFHIMFVYDPVEYMVNVYINGVLDSQQLIESEFNPGNILAIGAYPYADGVTNYQPWYGDIAMARIYDTAMNAEAVAQRYGEVKMPAAFVNDTPRPTPLLDLSVTEEGTLSNSGSLGAEVTPALVKNEDGQAPAVGVLKLNTYDKPILTFGHSIAEDATATDSYFKITREESPELFEKLNDGAYTIEAIIGTPAVGRCQTVPVSTEAFNLMYMPTASKHQVATYSRDRVHQWYNSIYRTTSDTYFHIVYVVNAASGQLAATFINGVHDASISEANGYITSLFDMSNLTIGCAVLSDDGQIPFCKAFDGNIVMVRVYDDALTALEIDRIYTEDNIKATLETLDMGVDANVTKPEPIVDVKFSNEDGIPTAKDVVGNVPLTLQTEGTPSGDSLRVSDDGIATFTRGNNEGWSFFKLDYSGNDMKAIRDAINDGFTVEVISSGISDGTSWLGLFGGDGYGLSDEGHRKWRLYYMDPNTSLGYGNAGNSSFTRTDGVYYHTLFTRNRTNNAYTIFVDGAQAHTTTQSVHVDSTYTMIGAWYDVATGWTGGWGKWNGNIVAFRIYDKPVVKGEVKLLYNDAKAQLDALNSANAQ